MRFQQYINEAKVKQTDADVFLDEYAPTFMWSPKSGFLWSAYNKKADKWEYYKGSKKMRGRKNDDSFMEHESILDAYNKKSTLEDLDEFIRGRINPNGKIIYIHDLYGRTYSFNEIHFDKYVDKTVNAVYSYMDKYIK